VSPEGCAVAQKPQLDSPDGTFWHHGKAGSPRWGTGRWHYHKLLREIEEW